jgi:hypothetical protein
LLFKICAAPRASEDLQHQELVKIRQCSPDGFKMILVLDKMVSWMSSFKQEG